MKHDPIDRVMCEAYVTFLAQLQRDRKRFIEFARFARDSGWPHIGAEFEGFARDIDTAIASVLEGAAS